MGDAILYIRGKSDKLKGDLDQSEKQVSGWANRIKNQLGESMNYAIGQIMAQGITQLSQGIENMARETINLGMEYARQVEDMARLSGASVEDASRIIQISDDMRMSYEDVSTALKMYAKTQADTGVKVEMSIDTLARLSDQYLALAPGVDRANFLLQNFGRNGLEMGKLLEQGGEGIRSMAGAVDDSLVMTEEGIRATEEYRRVMDDWEDAIAGVKLTLFKALLPYLEEFARWMVDRGIPALERFVIWFVNLPKPVQFTAFSIGGLILLLAKLGPALIGISGFLGLFKGGAAAAGTAAAGAGAKTGILATAIGGLKAALVAIAAALGTTVGMVLVLVAAIVALIAVLIKFGPQAANTVKMLVQIFAAGFERIKYEVTKFFLSIAAMFANGYNRLRQAGKNLVDGLWAGIQGAWADLKAKIMALVDELPQWVQDALGASSPAIKLMPAGEFAAQGIGKGFEEGINKEVKKTFQMGTLALASSAQRAAQVSVGRVEYHGRFSQSEMEYFDRRQEQISADTVLAALEGMAA